MSGRERADESRWPAARLALFYAAMFAAIGVYMPFWPVWLAAQGVTPVELGVLLSANHWLKIVTNPLIARIVDRRGERRMPLILLALATCAVFLPFPLVAGFAALLLLTLLNSVFFPAIVPVGENLALTVVYARRLDYGRIRLWGSIAFVAGALGGGALLTGRDEDVIWWTIVLAMAAMAAASVGLPEARTAPSTGSLPIGFGALLKNRAFVWFLIAGGLLQASHAVYYGFSAIAWRAAGIGETTIGALWALGVVAEILLFALSARLVVRFRPSSFLIAAAVVGLVRWSATPFTDWVPALALLQLLHALTFGAAHLGAMHFIARAAPAGASATAQGLYSGAAVGGLSGLAALAGGSLYAVIGSFAYLAMTGLSATALGAALLLARRWDGQTLGIGRR
jgi:PPP family 3-phenylpropionic acid transporter